MTRPVLTAAQMRDAEQAAADGGTSLATLMDRAGEALGRLVWRVASGRPVDILAGPGNNGGDGYVAACWLRDHGVDVRLIPLAPPGTDLARAAASRWGQGDTAVKPPRSAVLVDCLFGTGLNRPLGDDASELLSRHAARAVRIVAADLPSGLSTDDGALLGAPVRADVTLAFGALKPAHVLYPAAEYCGRVELADIGIGAASAVNMADMTGIAPPDWRSHKYQRGLVAVVAGAMPGAAELAARAAQRAGAGAVRLIGSTLPPASPRALMRFGWRDGQSLADPRIDAVVVGPGLGQGDGAGERVAAVLALGKPLVMDAGALTMVPAGGLRVPAILTPHAGEFARMGGDMAGGKIAASLAMARRVGAVVAHKGADTVIAAPDGRVAVHSPAYPWLSSAGTGDLLAGICGAMLAHGLEPFAAAQNAVLLHDRAARRAGPGLIADDLLRRPIWP